MRKVNAGFMPSYSLLLHSYVVFKNYQEIKSNTAQVHTSVLKPSSLPQKWKVLISETPVLSIPGDT